MDWIQELKEMARTPAAYGDTLSVTLLNGGAVSLAPFDDYGRPDEARRLILEPTQAHELGVRLLADPDEAALELARMIYDDRPDRSLYMLVLCCMSALGVIIGFIAGAFLV